MLLVELFIVMRDCALGSKASARLIGLRSAKEVGGLDGLDGVAREDEDA